MNIHDADGPAAQAKTLSTPGVGAMAQAPIQAPPTNEFSSEAGASSSSSTGEYLDSVEAPDREGGLPV
jgi:hypothetical protein